MAPSFSHIYSFFLTFVFSAPISYKETSSEKALMKEQCKKCLCTNTRPTANWNYQEHWKQRLASRRPLIVTEEIKMAGQQQWQSLKTTKTGCPSGLARVWKQIVNTNIQNRINSVQRFSNRCLPMAELSSDTLNFVRLRINQFLRKRESIHPGNLQLGFKHWEGRCLLLEYLNFRFIF